MQVDYISVQKAAVLMGVTPARIRQLIREHKIPANRFGKRAFLIPALDFLRIKPTLNRKPGRPRKAI